MYIFSYFITLLPVARVLPMNGVVLVLQLLELFIRGLQAYIFVSLINMYALERELSLPDPAELAAYKELISTR